MLSAAGLYKLMAHYAMTRHLDERAAQAESLGQPGMQICKSSIGVGGWGEAGV